MFCCCTLCLFVGVCFFFSPPFSFYPDYTWLIEQHQSMTFRFLAIVPPFLFRSLNPGPTPQSTPAYNQKQTHSLALSLAFSLSRTLPPSLSLSPSVIYLLSLPRPPSPSHFPLPPFSISFNNLVRATGWRPTTEFWDTVEAVSNYWRREEGAFSASVTIVSSLCNKLDRRK